MAKELLAANLSFMTWLSLWTELGFCAICWPDTNHVDILEFYFAFCSFFYKRVFQNQIEA